MHNELNVAAIGWEVLIRRPLLICSDVCQSEIP